MPTITAADMKRFRASSTAGQKNGKSYVVIDTHDAQGGKGNRRVSFHSTPQQAVAEAMRLNKENHD